MTNMSSQDRQTNKENGKPLRSEKPIGVNQNARATQVEYAVSKQRERQDEEGQEKKCCTGKCPEDLHSIFCCCGRRVGSMFFLCERKDGSPSVVAGPCWPFCTFVTLPLICVLSGLVLYFCMLVKDAPLPFWVIYIYIPLIAITLFSLFMVSCRDPGLLARKSEEDEVAFLWNEQVGSYRPPDALYCRECEVLIEDYDHLCPWTGTGIGKKNMVFFKIFVTTVSLLCYGSIGIVAYVLIKG